MKKFFIFLGQNLKTDRYCFWKAETAEFTGVLFSVAMPEQQTSEETFRHIPKIKFIINKWQREGL